MAAGQNLEHFLEPGFGIQRTREGFANLEQGPQSFVLGTRTVWRSTSGRNLGRRCHHSGVDKNVARDMERFDCHPPPRRPSTTKPQKFAHIADEIRQSLAVLFDTIVPSDGEQDKNV